MAQKVVVIHKYRLDKLLRKNIKKMIRINLMNQIKMRKELKNNKNNIRNIKRIVQFNFPCNNQSNYHNQLICNKICSPAKKQNHHCRIHSHCSNKDKMEKMMMTMMMLTKEMKEQRKQMKKKVLLNWRMKMYHQIIIIYQRKLHRLIQIPIALRR